MKPFEEQMRSKAVHPYPHKGRQSEFVVPISMALRIMRKCAEQCASVGVQAGYQCGIDAEAGAFTKDDGASLAAQIATDAITSLLRGTKRGKGKK